MSIYLGLFDWDVNFLAINSTTPLLVATVIVILFLMITEFLIKVIGGSHF